MSILKLTRIYQQRLLALIVSLTLVLGLLNIVSFPQEAQAQPHILISQQPGSPPSTPPAPNAKPAGGLGPQCSNTAETLIALISEDKPGLTTYENPTLLFYIPFEPENITGEFSVLEWPAETNEIDRARFSLPNTPGIVSIQIQPALNRRLNENIIYHWRFKLLCEENSDSNYEVDAFIQKVALTSEQGNLDTWYDTLALLADQLSALSQNRDVRNRWESLLSSINKASLADKPIVGPVQRLED